MNEANDLQKKWLLLEKKLLDRFGKKPDMETILFLIGVQELGGNQTNFSKEQKQDLMHIAICQLLSNSGYYKFERRDDEGWPHYKQLKPMPTMNAAEQENFLKDHILFYFEQNKFLHEN